MSYGYGGRGTRGYGGRGFGGGKMPPYPARGAIRYNPMGHRGGFEGRIRGRGRARAPPPPPPVMYEEPPKQKNIKKLRCQPCNNEDDKKSLYVVNIPEFATQEQLIYFFGQCGVVKNVTMPKDHKTGFHRGMAFIRFEHEDEVYFAIGAMTGKQLTPDSGYEPEYDEPGYGYIHQPKPLVVKIKEGEESTVHLENLPQSMKPKQLEDFLAKYGTLTKDIFIPKNTRTGVYRGVALARFECSEEADAVVNALNKKELKKEGKSFCILAPPSPKTQKLEVSICDDGCSLQVGNIPSGYSADVLEAMFSPYGSLSEQVDYSELRNRATVKFESEESAASAADALDGSEIEISGGKDQNSTEVDENQKVKKKKITVKLAHNESTNRTAFVTNIPKVYEEEDLRQLFNSFGVMVDVNVAKDPKTKQPRGMCFIKFDKAEDTNNFIESMNDKEIEVRVAFDPYLGYYELPPVRLRKLSVKPSTSNPENCVHISNLPKSITPAELTKMLTPYGKLEKNVTIPKDRVTGLPRGFTLVSFEDKEQAEAAIEGLNGKEIQEDESKVKHIMEGDYQPQEMDGFYDPRYEEPAYEGPPGPGYDGYGYDEYYDDYYEPQYPPVPPAHRPPPPPDPVKQLAVRKYNVDYSKNVGLTEANNTVWVGNIPQYMNNQQLEKVFSKYGTITMKINRPRDRYTGLFKEYTFIRYQNKEEAAAAIAAMNRDSQEDEDEEVEEEEDEEEDHDEWNNSHKQEGFSHNQDSAFWSDDPPQESGPTPWQDGIPNKPDASTRGLVNALSSLNKVCSHLGLLGPSLRATIEKALDVGNNAITILAVFQDPETKGMLELVDMKLKTLENKTTSSDEREMFASARKNVDRLKNPQIMMN